MGVPLSSSFPDLWPYASDLQIPRYGPPIYRWIVAGRVLDYASAMLRYRSPWGPLMPISDELLEILVCPETRQPVAPAAGELIDQLNQEIESGRLRNRGGDKLSQPIQEGLVREDGRILYLIEDDIPVMLIEESVELP